MDQNHPLFPNAGPGHWNDPDMLEVGNGTLTATENITHMSLWCIMAAPLLAGNDVRVMTNAVRDVYCNKEAIAVDQDSLGVQGRKVRDDGNLEVFLKPLKSWVGKEKAVVLFNRGSAAADIAVAWNEIGLENTKQATVRDLWQHKDMGSFTGQYSTNVAAHGVAMLIIIGEQKLSPPIADSYISDLSWYHMANGFGPAEIDKSNGNAAAGDGKTITLAGKTYTKGIGVNAPSELVYYLGGKGLKFTSEVGVDDEVNNSGSIQFIVYGDTKKLFASGAMTGSSATKNIDVDIAGVQVLRLLVTQSNDNNSSDHGDWANARITYTSTSVSPLPVTGYLPKLVINNSSLSYVVPHNRGVNSMVTIELFDLKGVLLRTLVNEQKNPGIYTTNLKNIHLSAGTYLVNVRMNNFNETAKIVKSE